MADPILVTVRLEGSNSDIDEIIKLVETNDFDGDVISKDIKNFGTSGLIYLECFDGDLEDYFLKLSTQFPEVIVFHQESSEYGETSVTFKNGKESKRKEELF